MTLECKSLHDIEREWKFSRMLTLYPQAVAEFVETKTLQEMAVLIQEYTSGRWTERRPVQGDSVHYQPLDWRRSLRVSIINLTQFSLFPLTPGTTRSRGRTDVVTGSWNAGSVTEEAIRNGTALSKVNSVKLYSSFRSRTLPGKVGRHECKLTLDSGVQLCLVCPELVA